MTRKPGGRGPGNQSEFQDVAKLSTVMRDASLTGCCPGQLRATARSMSSATRFTQPRAVGFDRHRQQ